MIAFIKKKNNLQLTNLSFYLQWVPFIPLRRSTRKGRHSIRSMEAEPVKTPSPKKKLTTKSSLSKRKAKTPALEKKPLILLKLRHLYAGPLESEGIEIHLDFN